MRGRAVSSDELGRPFRALVFWVSRPPRALPWATIGRACGGVARRVPFATIDRTVGALIHGIARVSPSSAPKGHAIVTQSNALGRGFLKHFRALKGRPNF